VPVYEPALSRCFQRLSLGLSPRPPPARRWINMAGTPGRYPGFQPQYAHV